MATKADFRLTPEHEQILTSFLAAITQFSQELDNREQTTIETETAYLQKIIDTTLNGNEPRQLSISEDSAPVPDVDALSGLLPPQRPVDPA